MQVEAASGWAGDELRSSGLLRSKLKSTYLFPPLTVPFSTCTCNYCVGLCGVFFNWSLSSTSVGNLSHGLRLLCHWAYQWWELSALHASSPNPLLISCTLRDAVFKFGCEGVIHHWEAMDRELSLKIVCQRTQLCKSSGFALDLNHLVDHCYTFLKHSESVS
jgi:hypothetical protein